VRQIRRCPHSSGIAGAEKISPHSLRHSFRDPGFSLAASYYQAGRTTDAITLQQRVLTDSERLLGDEHPTTLAIRAFLEQMSTSPVDGD